VRRSEPVKAYLLIEERVYPGAVLGTIGLRVQNRFNSGRYACTRTFEEFVVAEWRLLACKRWFTRDDLPRETAKCGHPNVDRRRLAEITGIDA
jgi:hypothetical protein